MESAALAATLEGLSFEDHDLGNAELKDAAPDAFDASGGVGAVAGFQHHRPLDVVGWSYGALIALDFALTHPQRIRTLTMIEPPAAWVLPDHGMNDRDVKVLQSLTVSDGISEADFEQFLRSAGLVPPGVVPKELPQWHVWWVHRWSFQRGFDPPGHRDDPARLRAFERPVLLVTGIGTAPFERRVQDTLAVRFPRVRAIELRQDMLRTSYRWTVSWPNSPSFTRAPAKRITDAPLRSAARRTSYGPGASGHGSAAVRAGVR